MNKTDCESRPDEALRWCKELVKKRAGNFYWGLRLLPEPRRSGLYTLYAWMRQADDIVDDARDPHLAKEELARFAEETRSLLAGGKRAEGSLWEAMSWMHSRWNLPSEPFEDMIKGQNADLEERVILDEDSLFTYCEQVASSVGLLCIEIWGYEDPGAPALAVDRGIALQLTNILRDIGVDAMSGRCYLPAAQLSEHGLDITSLVGWRRPESCNSLIEYWIDQARSRYESSLPLDQMVDPSCRRTLETMTAIYRRLLSRFEQDPQRVINVPGVRLSAFEKIRVALRPSRGTS